MPEVTASGERLDQWKGIADYLGRDVSTVIRWAKDSGLPVHRVPGKQQRRPVFAYRHEIDAWLASPRLVDDPPNGKTDIQFNGSGLSEAPVTDETEQAVATPAIPVTPVTHQSPNDSGRQGLRRRIVFWTLLTLLAVAATFTIQRRISPRGIEDRGETLVDSEIAPIDGGLVAGGGNLYFSAWREGRIALLTVPESGGPVREIPVPFVLAHSQAISKDGKRLLVLAGSGQEEERQLWWVPLDGNNPTRIGEFLCHSADLSPDGHTIAYSSGNAIYLYSDGSATSHLLHGFASIPHTLRWSLDGRRILALVSDTAGNSEVWRLFLDKRDPIALSSLARVAQLPVRYSSLSKVLNQNDDLFFSGDDDHRAIFRLNVSRFSMLLPARIETFTAMKLGASDLALDREARELFYGRGTTGRAELNIFDQRSNRIRPFLPGLWALDVDFSRDGRWIAYITDSGPSLKSLWVARSDGSDAKQVDTHGLEGLELPRWSPDGRQLAFMGQRRGELFRIYLAPAFGGKFREVSHTTDDQGAPTWSPDGRSLVYGRVRCQEENKCAIFHIDLVSGEVSMVPGSEGLSTARWSPDGRYIAALRTDSRELFLFSRQTRKWRKLADGVNGNDLDWSPDSRAIYASRPDGARPAILRISLSGKVENALDLIPWTRLTGRVDTWFNVTPDGSLLFVRLLAGTEIFSLHCCE